MLHSRFCAQSVTTGETKSPKGIKIIKIKIKIALKSGISIKNGTKNEY